MIFLLHSIWQRVLVIEDHFISMIYLIIIYVQATC
jgi:hypothetical protein